MPSTDILRTLGDAEVYYYQGTSFIDEVEAKLHEEMSRYLGCSMVETRVISGQMANAAVLVLLWTISIALTANPSQDV